MQTSTSACACKKMHVSKQTGTCTHKHTHMHSHTCKGAKIYKIYMHIVEEKDKILPLRISRGRGSRAGIE